MSPLRSAALLFMIGAGATVAQAAPPGADSQASVGRTGSMYDGTNADLPLPSDGSTADAAAANSASASGGLIPGQRSGASRPAQAGGGN